MLFMLLPGYVGRVHVLPRALGRLRDGQDAVRVDRRDGGADLHHVTLPRAHIIGADLLGN